MLNMQRTSFVSELPRCRGSSPQRRNARLFPSPTWAGLRTAQGSLSPPEISVRSARRTRASDANALCPSMIFMSDHENSIRGHYGLGLLPLGAANEVTDTTLPSPQTPNWTYQIDDPRFLTRRERIGQARSKIISEGANYQYRHQHHEYQHSISPHQLELSNLGGVKLELTAQPSYRPLADAHSIPGASASTIPFQSTIPTQSTDVPDNWLNNLKFESQTPDILTPPDTSSDADNKEDITLCAPLQRPRRRQWTDPNSTRFVCHRCNRGFKRKFNLGTHEKTHDKHRIRPFGCGYRSCNLSFDRPSDVNRHESCVHRNEKPFLCSHCPRSFKRKDSLQRHRLQGCVKREPMRSIGGLPDADWIRRGEHGSPQLPHPEFSGPNQTDPPQATPVAAFRGQPEDAGEMSHDLWRGPVKESSDSNFMSPRQSSGIMTTSAQPTSFSEAMLSHTPTVQFSDSMEAFDFNYPRFQWS